MNSDLKRKTSGDIDKLLEMLLEVVLEPSVPDRTIKCLMIRMFSILTYLGVKPFELFPDTSVRACVVLSAAKHLQYI